MAMFLGVHDMGGAVDDGTMGQNWSNYKAACANYGIKPLHVHFSGQKGRAYCVTEADSADQVQKAHQEAGAPPLEIIEVQTAE
jgi:hypothetical protein